MQSALVTGASGFIGRHLCRQLNARGIEVCALARRPTEGPWTRVVIADIRNPFSLPRDLRPDTVFHLAGLAHAASSEEMMANAYREVNVEGTEHVLHAVRESNIERIVYVSSVKAMGEGGPACVDESFEPLPIGAYGKTKLEAERSVERTAKSLDIHASILRLPLVYGTGVKGNLEKMLDAIARNRFPPFANISNKRSMVHANDVARAAILAAEKRSASGTTFLVTDGTPYSTTQIYHLMRSALGKKQPWIRIPMWTLRPAAKLGDGIGRALGLRFPIDSAALAKLSESAWYSSAKIETALGFDPSVDLEGALPEMVEHYLRALRSKT